jgi:hypothetical protein
VIDFCKTETERDEELFYSLVLIAIVCFKPLKTFVSSSKLPYQKVLRVLLKHFEKRKEMLLAALVRGMDKQSNACSYTKMVRYLIYGATLTSCLRFSNRGRIVEKNFQNLK